jgi:hypothetical protein
VSSKPEKTFVYHVYCFFRLLLPVVAMALVYFTVVSAFGIITVKSSWIECFRKSRLTSFCHYAMCNGVPAKLLRDVALTSNGDSAVEIEASR